MALQQTSLLAYRSLDATLINKRQCEVLDTLQAIYPACNRQVAQRSRLPINVVTPRMGELVKKGKVVKAYFGTDPKTGRKAIFWKPAPLKLSESWDI